LTQYDADDLTDEAIFVLVRVEGGDEGKPDMTVFVWAGPASMSQPWVAAGVAAVGAGKDEEEPIVHLCRSAAFERGGCVGGGKLQDQVAIVVEKNAGDESDGFWDVFDEGY
jgi:hypothetical protein